MFSFYEKGFKQSKPDRTIDVLLLMRMIKEGPQKDIIQQLRNCVYKSAEYSRLKEKISSITPAGIFGDERKPENVRELSGYLFFDVDNLGGTVEVNAYKQRLIEDFGDFICLMGTSVGAKGLFFYVQVDSLTKQNYNAAYDHIATEVFKSVNIDMNAKGINRPHIVTYDPEVHFNPIPTLLTIPETITKENCKKGTFSIKIEREGCYTLNVPFYDISEVLQRIHLQTPVEIGSPVIEINPVDYLRLFVRKEIPDGRKHATYRAITQALMFINPGIDLLTIQSYINYIDYNRTTAPMDTRKEMRRTVEYEYNRVLETGEFTISTSIKSVHFNPDCGLSGDERNRIASKVNGKIRKLGSIRKIAAARNELLLSGKKITKVEVTRLSGLSSKTVRRNWSRSSEELAEELVELLWKLNGGVSDSQIQTETCAGY